MASAEAPDQDCLKDILTLYQSLLKTKDRELMHYVLFSFKNYIEVLPNLWGKLGDENRQLVLEVIRAELKDAERIVEFSWRYHATYLKVL